MSEHTSPQPFVSVILPVRNEGAYIRKSLESVFAQTYPSALMEVLVADGMSTDGTREIVHSYQAAQPRLRLIDNPQRIVATGLNRAIAQAKGTIIVRVDGHCVIAPDYVAHCVARLHQGIDGVGGPVDTIGETPCARAIAVAMSTRFGVGDSAFRTSTDKTMLVDTVAFPAYWRAIIDRAGPFDEELVRNQDDEYNYRLRKMGARILLAAEVRSLYFSRSSLRSLWRQYFQYGFYKVRVMQKHPRQMRSRQFAPPAFAAALIGSLLIALAWDGARWLPLLVVGPYAVANLGASMMGASRAGWRTLPVLAVAYATLHLSFGFGFLTGCARFWNRWATPAHGATPISSPS